MKNFFRFLLAFVGVMLLYVYNNPEVIDKYKKDLMNSTEPDSTVTVEHIESDTVKNSVKVSAKDTVPVIVVNKEKKSELKFKSRKPIVRDKYTIDTASINELKCHFILEKNDKSDFYYPKCAPSINGKRYSNMRCFYAYVGVFNKGQVYTNLPLNMTIVDSVKLDIKKLVISVDEGDEFVISEKPDLYPGYNEKYSAAYYINLSEYQKLAWALYYADSAKVVYDNSGERREMAITSEELQYLRYSMDFYRSWIRCPKCVF